MNLLIISQCARPDEPFSNPDSLSPPQWEAAALTETPGIEVWVAPWYNLGVEDGVGITLEGPGFRSENHELVETRGPAPRYFDTVLCFPVPDSVVIDHTAHEVERAALKRLFGSEEGCDRGRHDIVLNCLRYAASAGQVTNRERGELELDNKVTFAMLMDTADCTPGAPRLKRPRTGLCSRSNLASVISSLDSPADYLVKPAMGSRGERIMLASALSEDETKSEKYWIIQELLKDPWTVRGLKADVRVYVVIVTQSRPGSFVTDTCMVRLGAVPFQHGVLDAEILSNSVRKRLKLPSATYPLDQVPVSISEKLEVHRATEKGAQDFIDMYFWWARNQNAGDTTHRILLWGLDLFLQRCPATQELTAWFLEANLYPFLFQFPENCRPAIWRLLSGQYGQALKMTAA
jgi:hypothetical protein